MSPVRLVLPGERRSSAAIANRPVVDILTGSGYGADGSDFAGFAQMGHGAPAVASEAARDLLFPAPLTGQQVYIERKGWQRWNGGRWVNGSTLDINIFDYDVRFNGSYDDAPGLIQAMSEIPAEGARYLLPNGVGMMGSTVVLPVNHVARFEGTGQAIIHGASPTLNGTVLKRAAGFTAPLFTQTGSSSLLNRGAHFSHLSIAGDLVAGDAFHIEYVNIMQFDCVTFHQIVGHALRGYSLWNAWLRNCRWYACGDATHEVVLLDGSTLAGASQSAGVHFDDPTFENNNGTDLRLTRENAPATAGTSDIQINGGKFEQSLAVPPGKPLCVVEATQHSHIRTTFGNGQHHDATHLKIGGTANSFVLGMTVDSLFMVSSTTDALNPRYLVDVLAHATGVVTNVSIKGHFRRGGGDGGAQIRFGAAASTKFSRVSIDRQASTFYGALSGRPIEGVDSGLGSVSGDRGDATQTVVYGLDAETQIWATTFTANRICHLSKVAEGNTNYPPAGAEVHVLRSAGGAFNLTVLNGFSGSTIKVMPAGTWGIYKFNGVDWSLKAYGTL